MLKKLLIKISDSYYEKKFEIEKKQAQKAMIKTLTELDETEYENFLKNLYKERTGKEMDFANPVTFTQKLQWLKLYDDAEDKVKYVDKYLVRKYVEEKIGSEYLIPLISIDGKDCFFNADEIDFNKLPNQFVMKCNHGSGYNIIVKDKSALSSKEIANMKKQLNLWLKEQFAYKNGLEIVYKNVKPCITIEQFMAFDDDLPDFKFFCFDGKPHLLYYMQNYTMHHKLGELGFFDMDFNLLDVCRNDYGRLKKIPEKPADFEKMKQLAEVLAEGFPHVRVDLYSIQGKVYFGELTFFTSSGFFSFNPDSYDKKFGELIKIDQSKRENNFGYRK